VVASARAPGKLVLAGEYAVLHGAPCLVLAVDRFVTATVSEGTPDAPLLPREVSATFALAAREGVLRGSPAVRFDTRALYAPGGHKLGLGSSAAACVAALAAALHAQGVALDRDVLARLCRQGHREAQGGGSGVDVLSSAYGGLLWVKPAPDPDQTPAVAPRELPEALPWAVLWTGQSARTSALVARVHTLRDRAPAEYATCMRGISDATESFALALGAGDSRRATEAVRDHGAWLDRLGHEAGAPVVTDGLRRLGVELEPLGAAVKPSGAGGGDVALVLAHDATALASALVTAEARGFSRVPLGVAREGVTARATED
jgi:phosphomevalonate kinase